LNSTPLRVALIRARYNPFGGAERFVANALDALRAQGVHTTLITRQWQPQPGVDALTVNPFYLGNVWRDSGFARAACRALQLEHFDLVQSHERLSCCHVFRAGDGVHAEWLAQRARVAGPWKQLSISLNPYHRYVLAAERRMFESAQLRAVICNSRMVRDEIVRHFQMPEDKLHVIYSGVDSERFSPELRARHRGAFRAQYQIPPDAPVYLYVGSGFERKGVGPFLRALARLPSDSIGVIVGKDKRQRAFARLAAQLGIAARVRFTGGLKDVAPAYGAADVFVLPTLYDPFPNAALEAMASGLPLVTSLKSGAAELIGQGVNGFACDALDIDALVGHMSALRDPSLRETLGQRARGTVLPMTFAAMSAQLVTLYRALLSLR
jgi:UDP-glucose:(heptosyl)LPS alpha-1,3-glucosyltransferase